MTPSQIASCPTICNKIMKDDIKEYRKNLMNSNEAEIKMAYERVKERKRERVRERKTESPTNRL